MRENGCPKCGGGPDPLLAKLTPHEKEAETSFVACALLEPATFGDLETDVDPEWFADPWLALAWAAARDLNRRGLPVNLVSVNKWLETAAPSKDGHHAVNVAEVSARIDRLHTAAASPANVNFYARLVRSGWLSRELAVLGRKITNLAFEPARPIEERLGDAEQGLFDLSRMLVEDAGPSSPSELMALLRERLRRIEELGTRPGTRTGIGAIDDILVGLQPGELSIVAGRPSMGKTAIVCDVLRRMARAGHRVALVSLETTKEQLAINWAASRAQVDSRNLRDGFVSKASRAPGGSIDMAMNEIGELDGQHFTIDRGIRSIGDVRRVARLLAVRQGVEVVAIDYLQLLREERKYKDRQEEVQAISVESKAMARDLGIHIIAICQLNRRPESRAGNEPQMSDLRDSGQLEQDADVIMLLHRPGYYDRDEDQSQTFVAVAKNRNGATGRAELVFIREQNRFEEPAGDGAPGRTYDHP